MQVLLFTIHTSASSDDTLIISESGGDATVWDWSSNGSASILSFEDSSTQVVGMVNGEVFTVTIEDDNGCSNSGSTTIVVNPKPTNVTSTSYGTYCSSDAPFNLSGGSPIGGYYAGQGVSNNMFDHVFTSAKTGEGIASLFGQIKDAILVHQSEWMAPSLPVLPQQPESVASPGCSC